MVILCLGALALFCWPSRPALNRLSGSAYPGGPTPGARRGDSWWRRGGTGRRPGAGRSTGRRGAVPGVLVVGVVTLPAGPAASCSALLTAGTLAGLASAELRRRRDSRQVAILLVATRTLAREVRTGAAPVAAVLATAAAHPACAPALEQLAVAVVARRGSPAAAPGPDAAEGGRGRGRGRDRGGGGRGDQQADVIRRLGDSWGLSARCGVPWAALIDTVATDLAERQRADALRTAQVAGPRVSGYVLAVMPALGVLLGAGMGADPVHVLLDTGVGAVLLLVGSALTCLGLAWTAAIVRA